MSYRIFETEEFAKNLHEIARGGSAKIAQKLRTVIYPALKQQPHFGPQIKKLKNWEPSTWRYRIGSWRFFYEIHEQEKIVFMIAAVHRSEAYRK